MTAKLSSKLAALALAALPLFGSCAPQAFVVTSQMRGPSKSGLNLYGKSIAVVYVDGEGGGDSPVGESVTEGFVSRMEEDYFDGEQTIGTFRMPLDRTGDYSSKDTLVNLVLDTGSDVVFLFDQPVFGEARISDPQKVKGEKMPADSSYLSSVTVPFTTRVYVYDSMNRSDKVFAFSGSKDLSPIIYSDGRTPKEALKEKIPSSVSETARNAGYQAASSFLSVWKEESFLVIYYEASEKAWDEGAENAHKHLWKEAIESWMPLLQSPNAQKRSCASYNIALGCFLLGQPSLALEWLDRSDKDKPVSLSATLRMKINEYSGL